MISLLCFDSGCSFATTTNPSLLTFDRARHDPMWLLFGQFNGFLSGFNLHLLELLLRQPDFLLLLPLSGSFSEEFNDLGLQLWPPRKLNSIQIVVLPFNLPVLWESDPIP